MHDFFGQLEHNVRFVYLFTVSYWISNSIIAQQVLSGYIYVLTNSIKPVGIVRAIQGLTQLLCALPAGYAADSLRRDRVLALAGGIGVVAALLTGFAIQIGYLPLVYAAFGVWGLFTAVQSPSMEALFADSVPMGQRSWPFTLKHVLLNTALVIGPSCAILLFWQYGDTWELPVLRPVLLFGTFLAALSMAVLFQFNDDMAYENRQYVMAVERELCSIERNFDVEYSNYLIPSAEGSEVTGHRGEETNSLPVAFSPINTQTGSSECSQLLMSPTSTSTRAIYFATQPNELGEDWDLPNHKPEIPTAKTIPTYCGLDAAHVPSVLFLSDFIVSNAMGMIVNFFPLFFFQEFALTPIQVQVLFVLQPIGVALFAFLAQTLSRCCGRMPVIVFTRLIGVTCLVGMVFATKKYTQCALFLFREALMQCTDPLRRSLLMDFVPKRNRAKWNALESITVFGYAGSAVLGGMVVEAHGYRFCFFVSAIVYSVGVLLDMILIPLTRHAVETHSNSS